MLVGNDAGAFGAITDGAFGKTFLNRLTGSRFGFQSDLTSCDANGDSVRSPAAKYGV
jgi:hypothetical protein